MPSTRIKGKSLILELAGVEYACDATSVELSSEEADSDVTTFCDAAAGGAYDYKFTVNAITSLDTTSFWRYVWENPGESGVAYVFAPAGNEEPSESQPHFTGTVTLPGGMPTLSTEANSTSTFEVEFKCDQRPTLDNGESA